MDLYDSLLVASQANPDKVFLSNATESHTYREVFEAAQELADRMREVATPDRPCMIQADSISAGVAVLACLSIRKPFVPISGSTPEARFHYLCEDSGSDLLVRDRVVERGLPGNRAVRPSLESIECASEPWTTVGDPADVACLIYTSGSTGMPKAVVCSRKSVTFAVQAIDEALQYRPSDVVVTALPIFFDFGLYQVFLAARNGASLYFATELESSMGLSDLLERTGATILPMVPPAAEKLVRLIKRGLRSHRVRQISTTGAAMNAETRLAIERSWGALRR